MNRKIDYKKKMVDILHELAKKYPTFSFPRHISTAFSDYGDFWGMSDKEACFALEKYQAELELDVLNIAADNYVDEIVEDGKHLFDEQEEDDGY